MEVIASFQSPAGTLIRVIRGDARECPADVAIFGKNRDLRRELVRESGREFEILGPKYRDPTQGRFTTRDLYKADVIDLRDRGCSWQCAVSIRYRPRRFDPRCLRRLSVRVSNVIFRCNWKLEGRSFVLMALSWRYPELNSLAVVHGVVDHVRRRVRWELPRPPIERIDLVDREDPSPFVRALRDEDGCLSRAGLSVVKLREL